MRVMYPECMNVFDKHVSDMKIMGTKFESIKECKGGIGSLSDHCNTMVVVAIWAVKHGE